MAKTKKALSVTEDASLEGKTAVKKTVLLELENLAANGRGMLFDLLRKILDDKGMKLTEPLFSRYFVGVAIKVGLAQFMEVTGKTKLSRDKLMIEIAETINSTFLKAKVSANPAVQKLINMAMEKGYAVGVLSCLENESSRQFAENLGLLKDVTYILSCSCTDKAFPSNDAWLRLARNMTTTPGACMAVATSGNSCKAAVSSGMHCVVIPDRFTGFQDFGGADLVSDKLDNDTISSIFTILEEA